MTTTTKKTNFGLTAVLVASAVLLAAVLSGAFRQNNDRRIMQFDGPVFSSVESLHVDADLAIRGTVGDVISRQTDFGGQARWLDRGNGLPIALYEVAVTEVLRGDVRSEVIVVALLDPQSVASDSVVDLRRGDDIVLYLREEDRSTAPGIEVAADVFYTPLNYSNGVLRVQGNDVVTTAEFPIALTTAQAVAIEEERSSDEEADGQVGVFSEARFAATEILN